ncbi:MAG TPA: hypothetical protein VLC09_06065 [Polyangiaceae bacterium]|nr:hypothetical protein [Polyangiaceae bacterium]
MKKQSLLDSLRGLLRQSFELGRRGALQEKQARAQGYADGYLRALADVGIANERDLLQLVQEVRRGSFGPATAVFQPEDQSLAV